jgi:hypothetical protein
MTFVFPEKVSIRNIKSIHSDLLTYVGNNKAIEIDLDTCQDADLSLVQLIEAARKTVATSGRTISLTKPANDTIQSTLRRAGFLDKLSPEDAKFWLHKEMN